MRTTLPEEGTPWSELESQMQTLREKDVDWRGGRASVYVFHPGDDVLDVAHSAYGSFISENGLGPGAFPSLKRMEREVLEMALSLQNAPEDAGASMTSGGTESILLALKTCRDHVAATRPVPGTPQIVLPSSGHPAFDKGAHLMGLEVVRVPVADDFRADPEAMRAAVTPNTVMLVGSACCFPYGVIDPIDALSDLAQERDLWLHVDACVGGYVAPFMREVDPQVPACDFSLPGVTSMSADLHKYGYAAKGASTVLYRTQALRQLQTFSFDDWPCGTMVTPTLAGTRPGGAIAAAWAVMRYLGRAGYIERAARIYAARISLQATLEALNLRCFGDPRLSLIAFGADDFDIFAVGDQLYREGWFSSRTRAPDGIHLMISPEHERTMTEYLDVLIRLTNDTRAGRLSRGKGAVSYAS